MGELFFEEQSAVTDAHEHSKKNNKIHIEDIEMHSDLSNEQSAKSPRSAIFSKGLGQTTGKINIFEPIQE